jgi:hypothetical protein
VAGEIKTTEELFGASPNQSPVGLDKVEQPNAYDYSAFMPSDPDEPTTIEQQVSKELAYSEKNNVSFDEAKKNLRGYSLLRDYAGSVKETPANVWIGTLGVTASALEAIKRRALQFISGGVYSPWQDQLIKMVEVVPEEYLEKRAEEEATFKKIAKNPANPYEEAMSVYRQQLKKALNPEPTFNPEANVTEAFSIPLRLPDAAAKAIRRREAALQMQQDSITFRTSPIMRTSRAVMQGGVPSFAVALGISALTGDPLIGLAILGETSGGAEFQEQLNAGASPTKAQLFADLNEAAEIGGEALVFPKFVRGITHGIPLSEGILYILENAGQEGGTGFAQTFLTVFGELTTNGMSPKEAIPIAFDEGVKAIPENALVGAGVGTVGSATGVGVRALQSTVAEPTAAVEGQTPADAAPTAPESATGQVQPSAEKQPVERSDVKRPASMPEHEYSAPGLVKIESDIGEIRIPESELTGEYGQDLETIFAYGNFQSEVEQPALKRSLSVGDTIQYRKHTLMVMQQGWRDITGLSAGDIKAIQTSENAVGIDASWRQAEQKLQRGLQAKQSTTPPAPSTEKQSIAPPATTKETQAQAAQETTTQKTPAQETTSIDNQSPFVKRVLARTQELFANPKAETEVQTLSKDIAAQLKSQKTLSKEEFKKIEKEKSIELSRRVGKMAGTIESMRKQDASSSELQRAVGVLKGSLYVKQRWPSVRTQVGNETIEKMHAYIWDLPQWRLRLLEKQTTAMSLDKLIDGYYLAKDEITHISDVFPQLGQVALSRRPASTRTIDSILSIVGLPKATLASGDISAMGRQLLYLWGAYPELMPQAQWESIKIAGRWKSDVYAKALEEAMDEDPFFHFAKDYVAITKPGSRAVGREMMEEKFPSRFISALPGVARSEAAFADISTLMRIAALDTQVRHAEEMGKTLTDAELKKIGHTIDVLSGRMDLPKALEPLSAALSTVFFSSRTLGARIVAPFKLVSLNPQARMMALRSFTTIGAVITTLLLLAKLAHKHNEDIDAELNPLSGNGLKIRIKNLWIDPTGGYGSLIRAVARLATGMTKTQAGRIREAPRKEIVANFLKTKQSPALSLASKAWTGEDFLGNQAFQPPQGTVGEWMTELGIPRSAQIVSKELYETFMFLPVQDVISAGQTDGWLSGLIAGPLAVEGIGLVAFPESKSTGFQRKQDELSITAFGKPWSQTTVSQKQQITKEIPYLAELEVEVQKERTQKVLGGREYPSKSQMETQDEMYKGIPPVIKEELESLGLRDIGGVGRSIAGFYLNDDEFGEYVKRAGEYVTGDLNTLLVDSDYTSLTKESEKREVVVKTIKSAKSRALKELKEEWNIEDNE